MVTAEPRTPEVIFAEITEAMNAEPDMDENLTEGAMWTAYADHDARLAALWSELYVTALDAQAPEWATCAATLRASALGDRARDSRRKAARWMAQHEVTL